MRKRILLLGALICISCFGAGCSKNTDGTDTSTEMVNQEQETRQETAAETEEQSNLQSEQNIEQSMIEKTDYLAAQASVDKQLQEEVKKGYTIDEPLVVVNPYGNSPLTAIAVFSTEQPMSVNVVTHGKRTEDNVEGNFEDETEHVIPIYGLYAGGDTEVTFTLGDGTKKTVSVTTDSIENPVADAEVTTIDNEAYDFSKLTFASSGTENVITAYDSQGAVRWYFKTSGMPFKQLSNGHFITQTSTLLHPLYYMSGIMEFDLCGKVYQDYSIPGGSHHAIYEMSNGNLLVGSSTTDYSKVEDRIVELDRNTGEVVYDLQLEELMDTEDGGSINWSEVDWFHNNAIWYDEKSDTILLSGRHVDAVVGIDKTNKTLKWVLGDPEGWKTIDAKYFFTPMGDNFEWQYAQHNITMLPNGDLMLFDNGHSRTKATKPDNGVKGDEVYSRAVVYRIDVENMTVEQVWQYGKERGAEWYSSFISGVNYNGENDYWITSGGVLYDSVSKTYDISPAKQFSEGIEKMAYINQVKDDKLVFEMKIPTLIYRSIHAPMYQESNKSIDLNVAGKWLGDIGETKTVDLNDIDGKIVHDKAVEGDVTWKYSQTPFALMFSGSVKSDNIEVVKDGYLILEDKEGEQKVYMLTQKPVPGENGGGTLSLMGTISSVGLEKQSYHIYIQADGTVYDTGKEVEF